MNRNEGKTEVFMIHILDIIILCRNINNVPLCAVTPVSVGTFIKAEVNVPPPFRPFSKTHVHEAQLNLN